MKKKQTKKNVPFTASMEKATKPIFFFFFVKRGLIFKQLVSTQFKPHIKHCFYEKKLIEIRKINTIKVSSVKTEMLLGKYQRNYPAGTWRKGNIDATLQKRHVPAGVYFHIAS